MKTQSPRTGIGVRSAVPGASLASGGPSAARTQGAVLGAALDKSAKCPVWGEDAAARSVSAAARGVRGAAERTLTTLRAFLSAQGTGASLSATVTGSGAPRAARRLVAATVTALLALTAALLFSTAPALAAAPCPNEALRTENESFRKSALEEQFTEPIASVVSLPECRSYERVTPKFKNGTYVDTAGIAPDGSRMLVDGLGAFAGTQSDQGAAGAFYELSRTGSGWSASAVAPPGSAFPAQIYLAASPGLERTLWFARTPTQSIYAEDLYVREPDGEMVKVGPTLDPGETLGGPAGEEQRFGYLGFVMFDSASEDLSHVAFTLLTGQPPQGAPLWPGDTTSSNHVANPSLYEYTGAGQQQPVLVGVADPLTETLEGGKTVYPPAGTLISDCGTEFGAGALGAYNAMSRDGGTVFFTALGHSQNGCGPEIKAPDVSEVFARVDGFRTIAISEPTAPSCLACDTEARAPALFAGASEDGTKAFFMTTQPLLEHASSMNLYEYDFNAPKHERVSRVSTGSGEPEVQGVARVSEDGSHVYFVAKGQLLPSGTADTSAGSDELTSVTTATGTANLVAGEQFVEGLATSTGVFTVGQAISGAGLAPGTTITRVGEGFLELSAPAEASGTGVDLSAGAQPFAVGDVVAGAGVPAGDTITAVEGQTLTLSAPASASASGVTVTAANREGATPTARADNLYVYEHDEAFPHGRLQFVATLSPEDKYDWEAQNGYKQVQATPDGRFLVFQSRADLTAGDEAPEADPQIFEYDAEREELVRVSTGQAGYASGLANSNQHPASIIAQNLSGAGTSPAARYARLALSGDGATIMFSSAAALSEQAQPAEAAGAESVYEYHSDVSSAGGSISDGEVYLLSDGRDEAQINRGSKGDLPVGITLSGDDLFFQSADQLVSGGGDSSFGVYDARVGGGFAAPPAPMGCEAEECLAAPSAEPAFAGAVSLVPAAGDTAAPAPPLGVTPLRRSKTAAEFRAAMLARAVRACRRRPPDRRRACRAAAARRYGVRAAAKAKRGGRR